MKKRICGVLLMATFVLVLSGCAVEESAEKEKGKATTESVLAPFNQGEKKEEQTEGLQESLVEKMTENAGMSNQLNRMLDDSLFCVDEATGAVYFVNQNKDHYLYRIYDGEVKLAVEMPVKEVYCREGKVYFIISSYEKYDLGDMKEGAIYCYNPEKGSVQCLYSGATMDGHAITRMNVKEDAVYFLSEGLGEETEINGISVKMMETFCWRLPYEGGEVTAASPYDVGKKWRNYRVLPINLSSDATAYPMLALMNCEVIGDNRSLGITSGTYCILGDWLCYIKKGNSKVMFLHLETGEEKSFDFYSAIQVANFRTDEEMQEYIAEESGVTLIYSFTMTEGGKYLWISDSGFLHRMDTESGQITTYVTANEKRFIERLYTDGENLYAMYAPSSMGVTSLVRLTETDEISLLGSAMMNVEYLTE